MSKVFRRQRSSTSIVDNIHEVGCESGVRESDQVDVNRIGRDKISKGGWELVTTVVSGVGVRDAVECGVKGSGVE